MSRKMFYAKVIGFALLITFAILWSVFQWGECREMGFSVWYCIQHIG